MQFFIEILWKKKKRKKYCKLSTNYVIIVHLLVFTFQDSRISFWYYNEVHVFCINLHEFTCMSANCNWSTHYVSLGWTLDINKLYTWYQRIPSCNNIALSYIYRGDDDEFKNTQSLVFLHNIISTIIFFLFSFSNRSFLCIL